MDEAAVRGIVENMPLTAKLKGLAALIDQLKRQNPERWPDGLTVRKRKAASTCYYRERIDCADNPLLA